MKVDRFKLYLFSKLKQYQEDLKLSDIEIIDDDNETIKEEVKCNRMDETDYEAVQLQQIHQDIGS